MSNTAAVNDSLKVQIDAYPTALLCPPTLKNAKQPDFAKNTLNWGSKHATTPNTLNAWSNNYGKLTYESKEIGKSLRIKMSHQPSAVQKTILFPNTFLSLLALCHHCGRRGP
jgi:hypothetical protein